LVVLTAIVALALGLFRTLLLMGPRSILPGISDFVQSMCEITVVLFPVMIVPWFTIVNLKNGVSTIMCALVLAGIVEGAAYCIFQWLSRDPETVQIFVFVQLGASLSMLATALVLRLCGFRMAWISSSGARINA
jgi:hypothetical protein